MTKASVRRLKMEPAVSQARPRVALRSHRPADLGAFLVWYADPHLAHLTRHDQTPLPHEAIRRFFWDSILPASALGHSFAIVLEAEDRLIGTCSLTDLTSDNREATLRILIGPSDCWGKGYGTEAVRLLARHGFDHLGLAEISLGVFDFNRRAILSYERVGFRTIGTMRLMMPPGCAPASEVLMVLGAARFRALHASASSL